MDDFNSETDSDYTSYWRDWVSFKYFHMLCAPLDNDLGGKHNHDRDEEGIMPKSVNKLTHAFRSDNDIDIYKPRAPPDHNFRLLTA